MIGIRKIGLNIKSGGFGAEYQAVYDALTTKPSGSIANAQDTMVAALVSAGVWAKMDVFYLWAQTINSDSEALKNWKNPGTYDASNIHVTAFVALEGFTSDGANDYLDLNWNPSANGVKYLQDDASVGVYLRTDQDDGNLDFGAKDGSGNLSYLITRSGNNANGRINSSGGGTAANSNSSGMFVLNRVLSSHQDVWRNKVRIANVARPSSGVPNIDMFSLAYNNNGAAAAFSTRQQSVFFAGGGLIQTNIEDLTDAIEVYMDSNSKGVI